MWNRSSPQCEHCQKNISQERYRVFGPMCKECFLSKLDSKCSVKDATIPKPKERTMLEGTLVEHSNNQKEGRAMPDESINDLAKRAVEAAQEMAKDERIVAIPQRSGVKDDQGKPMWHLLPWKAVAGMVKVLTFGAVKYSEDGWRTVPNAQKRYTAALLRHLAALSVGEKLDSESGLRHIDHVLTNAAFLAELED
jgi:hypothetical protein